MKSAQADSGLTTSSDSEGGDVEGSISNATAAASTTVTQVDVEVDSQDLEDSQLAAALVKAAGNRASLSNAVCLEAQAQDGSGTKSNKRKISDTHESSPTATDDGAEKITQDRAMIELRSKILNFGGPDLQIRGWTCRIMHSSVDDAKMFLFLAPTGEKFTKLQEILEHLAKTNDVSQSVLSDAHYLSWEKVELQYNNGKNASYRQDAPNRLLGEYSLPIYNEEGKLVLESLGEIITSHKHFHDETHIFPVGYRAIRTYKTRQDGKPSRFSCEIMHCGTQPLFRITPLDNPEKRMAGNNASEVLSQVSVKIRSEMSGEKFFGLEGYEQITSLIENLPGAAFCNNYKKWSNNRPPAAKLPPPTFSMRICRAIAVSPMAECKALLKDITGHVCAWPFLEPIATATSELENYSQKVKRPMDLGTIQQKLNDGKYMNPHQVRFDVIQVWRNCLYYSGEQDDATIMAREISNSFEELFSDRVHDPAVRESRGFFHKAEDLMNEAVLVLDPAEFLWRKGTVVEVDKSSGSVCILLDKWEQTEDVIKSRWKANSTSAASSTNRFFGKLKTDVCMPDLLPASVILKIDRRDRERQLRLYLQGKGVWKDKKLKIWMRVPSPDVVFTRVQEVEASRWDSEWPGTVASV
uniref:Bromo domain-containing protein n=1 Tax=Guillardia theta TaxID=55529 RepID=A0A7S4LZM6_GUITH|mmetsp:Transcript_1008/g.3164  ORF Transcript_1008/g.3164 Transcript_1008/m.3164 type:complete len:638 (+) Transcript_1008:136-2049(+)